MSSKSDVTYIPEVDLSGIPDDITELMSDINPCLFVSRPGIPMEFFLRVKCPVQKKNLDDLISEGSGEILEDEEQITPYTIVLVDTKPSIMPSRPTFNATWVITCIEKDELLDISRYAYCDRSVTPEDFNFMAVVYLRTTCFLGEYTKDECLQVESNPPSPPSPPDYIPPQAGSSKGRKSTRTPYSLEEKEAILKFLVKYNRFSNLRGDQVWKSMERRNVCPNRTYQSLKEHFTKKILRDLDRFPFLTREQRKKFRDNFPTPKYF